MDFEPLVPHVITFLGATAAAGIGLVKWSLDRRKHGPPAGRGLVRNPLLLLIVCGYLCTVSGIVAAYVGDLERAVSARERETNLRRSEKALSESLDDYKRSVDELVVEFQLQNTPRDQWVALMKVRSDYRRLILDLHGQVLSPPETTRLWPTTKLVLDAVEKRKVNAPGVNLTALREDLLRLRYGTFKAVFGSDDDLSKLETDEKKIVSELNNELTLAAADRALPQLQQLLEHARATASLPRSRR